MRFGGRVHTYVERWTTKAEADVGSWDVHTKVWAYVGSEPDLPAGFSFEGESIAGSGQQWTRSRSALGSIEYAIGRDALNSF